MNLAKNTLDAVRTAPLLLLLVVLILALAGCGDEETSSSGGGGEEETTAAEAGGQAGGATVPPERVGMILDLTPSEDSSVSGTATLTNTEDGVQVIMNMQDLTEDPGTQLFAHIHEGGTCDDDTAGDSTPVQYQLTPLRTGPDGTAASVTIIEGVTVPELSSDTPRFIDVHPESTGEEASPAISCADVS